MPLADIPMRVRHLTVHAVIIDDLVLFLTVASPFGEAALATKDICDDRYPLLQIFVTHSRFVLAIDALGHLSEEQPLLLLGFEPGDFVGRELRNLLESKIRQSVVSLRKPL